MILYEIPSHSVRKMIQQDDLTMKDMCDQRKLLQNQRVRRPLEVDLAWLNICLTAIFGLALFAHLIWGK